MVPRRLNIIWLVCFCVLVAEKAKREGRHQNLLSVNHLECIVNWCQKRRISVLIKSSHRNIIASYSLGELRKVFQFNSCSHFSSVF